MTDAAGPPARVALLGAGGRVGPLLVRAAAQLGWPSFCLVQSRGAGPGVTHRIDPLAGVSAADALAAGLADAAPDLVAVLWGATGRAADGPGDPNVALARLAVDLAARAGCPRVAVMSSMAVYGPVQRAAETAQGHPANPYGAAKLRMEEALRTYAADAAAPEVIALRLANVCGADMLADAAATATATAPLHLDRFPDGTGPRRSYLSPVTLCRLLGRLAEAHAGTLPARLNVADGPDPVAMDALLHARAEAGRPVPWRWRPAPPQALPEVSMDIAKLRRLWPAERLPLRDGATALARDWLTLGRETA